MHSFTAYVCAQHHLVTTPWVKVYHVGHKRASFPSVGLPPYKREPHSVMMCSYRAHATETNFYKRYKTTPQPKSISLLSCYYNPTHSFHIKNE